MILLIKHKTYWELRCHRNQAQINQYNNNKNSNILHHDYKVRDKLMCTNNTSFEYKTPHVGPFEITQFWTNGTIILQYGEIKIMNIICLIKPCISNTNVEGIIYEI